MKVKSILTIITFLALSACGGGSESSNTNAFSSDKKTQYSSSRPASLSNLAGVWDISEIIDNKKDIAYTVIKSDGSIADYDYQNDEYDRGSDCYKISRYKITDLGNGKFKNKDGEIAKITVNGNSATTTFTEGKTTTINTIYKSSKNEKDLKPICS